RAIACEAPLRTRIHTRSDEADATITRLDQVPGDREPAVEMREADQHVDRIRPGFHDLHDRAFGVHEQPPRGFRLIDAGDDQRGRTLTEKDLQEALLLEAGVVRVADLYLKAGVAQPVVNSAYHIGK